MKLCLFKTAMLKHENAEVETVQTNIKLACIHKKSHVFFSHYVSDDRFVLVLAHSVCL